MIEVSAAALAGAAAGGALIGLLYFGALWWTVRRLHSAQFPAVLMVGSFLLRAAVAAAGIVFVARGEWLALVAALTGFLVGRTILTRAVGKPLREGGLAAAPAAEFGGETDQRSAVSARRD